MDSREPELIGVQWKNFNQGSSVAAINDFFLSFNILISAMRRSAIDRDRKRGMNVF